MQKMQKSAKKCNFQRNSLINPHRALKKASGAFGAGMKMSKKCNFPTFGIPFPSPKLHQDAKKVQKIQLLEKTENAKKMQVAFFPLPCVWGVHLDRGSLCNKVQSE
jgi:hypothetical protein